MVIRGSNMADVPLVLLVLSRIRGLMEMKGCWKDYVDFVGVVVEYTCRISLGNK